MVAQIDSQYVNKSWSKSVLRIVAWALFEGRPLTTKGRWINGIVNTHYKLAVLNRFWKTPEKPIFILGTGRSGSTALGKLLSLYPNVLFLNEPKLLWHNVYPSEDIHGNFGAPGNRLTLTVKDAEGQVQECAKRLYGFLATVTGQSRILDKHGELIFRAEFLDTIFPDGKYIVLIRDGWDVVRSIVNWNKVNTQECGGLVHDWWGKNGSKWKALVADGLTLTSLSTHVNEIEKLVDDADRAAVEWVVTMEFAKKLLERIPDRCYIVKYEDVLSDPVRMLRELAAFCELQKSNRAEQYAESVLRRMRRKEPYMEISPFLSEALENLRRTFGYT